LTAYEIVERPADWPQRDLLGEGPLWSQAEACLYWVDIVGKRACRFRPADRAFHHWSLPAPCSAIVPTTQGDAIVALADGLHRLDLETGLSRPFGRPDLDPGNRSNECRCDPQGRLWLGTMHNNIGPQGEPLPITRSSGTLSCIGADGVVVRLLEGVGIVNTLAWSPDGRRLYTADSLKGVIYSFAYHADGPALSDRQVLAAGLPGSPDGSAMDEAGCLWTAYWGAGRLVRFTPEGKIDQTLTLPVAQPSCCAFGGDDLRTLYVTSARQALEGLEPHSLDGALFAIRVETPGMVETLFKG